MKEKRTIILAGNLNPGLIIPLSQRWTTRQFIELEGGEDYNTYNNVFQFQMVDSMNSIGFHVCG